MSTTNNWSKPLIRKFRWTLAADFPSGKVPEMFIKLSSRPSVESDVPKQVTTIFYDCDNNNFKSICDIFAPLYELEPQEYSEKLQNFLGTVFLTMYSGVGEALEKYALYKAWPTSINFCELDHSNSSETDVEITWKYESCELITTKDS